MGDNEGTKTATIADVRKVFQEENTGLLVKLESNWPKPAPSEGAKLAQETSEKDEVTMHAAGLGGIVDTLDGVRVPVLNLSLPVGSALLGGVGGIVVGDVIDLVLPPPRGSDGQPTINLSPKSLINVGVQAVGTAAVLWWGPGLVGGTATKFAAGVMVLRVLLRVPAVRNFINAAGGAIATPLKGIVPAVSAGQGAVAQAEQILAGQVIYGDNHFKDAL